MAAFNKNVKEDFKIDVETQETVIATVVKDETGRIKGNMNAEKCIRCL